MTSEILVIFQIGRPEEGKKFGQKGHYFPAKELLFLAFLELPQEISGKIHWPDLSPMATLSFQED